MVEIRKEIDLEASAEDRGISRGSLARFKEQVKGSGISFALHFADARKHPFEQIEWEMRDSEITDEKGKVVFAQKGVEVPRNWSMLATNVVASKYFYGELGTPERETSVRQLVHRVTRTLADWGWADGYFATRDDAENFYRELTWLCVNQRAAFNSPVWFNVGLYHQYGIRGSSGNYFYDREAGCAVRSNDTYQHPQGAACFIQSVDDTMEDIMRLASSEAMLFKYGSGTGSDLSALRSRREKLSGGGRPSGPLSFMRVYDQIASVVKSGGKTRRAAKMQSLKVNHPDILDFIEAKMKEEKKAWALMEQGYNGSYNGEAYASIFFQNANFSVRVTDEFMQAVEKRLPWQTHAVTTGEPMDVYQADELMRKIAEGTHICGDPGLQYDTTINRWHTCPNSGSINASNPCSEYMFLDDSACNLASLNLMKFRNPDGSYDIEGFRHAVRTLIIAQEILVDNASYPTAQIAQHSHDFRPLGLGFANLGSLIMSLGLPYDSDEGRAYAGTITAIMCGEAYRTSAEVASELGSFPRFEENRQPMLNVMEMHRSAVDRIPEFKCPAELLEEATAVWDEAVALGAEYGYRNAQTTVLAPTGTIGFLMDCDTTGVEPDIALVKYKVLAGGGMLKIVNRTIPQALTVLGYSDKEISDIVAYIEKTDTIEGAPHLRKTDLPVFDCAFPPANGSRSIEYMAHLRMMAAAQPFLSGAISKTVNMPQASTIEDIMEAYMEGWRLGLKAVAIYRDGSKRSQPLNTSREGDGEKRVTEPAPVIVQAPPRKRMPLTRRSLTHKFEIAGHEGYLTVGLYEDGMPGELFIIMAKEGSTIGGLMDCFGTAISLGLQYGVPLDAFIKKFAHTRFEPSGWTKNPDIPLAKSLVDYIFRWLAKEFPSADSEGLADAEPHEPELPKIAAEADAASKQRVNRPVPQYLEITGDGARPEPADELDRSFAHFQQDAPLCDNCGHITVRNGSCYRCHNCGASMGCS
ncbi:MAG: vitamin B12-dependent ribonucleotide reductase [Verrucomicrobiota bacterium]|nr:vitamin B12-dependent ribonucleotide reductase [Verrucomicrobiota bacterium]